MCFLVMEYYSCVEKYNSKYTYIYNAYIYAIHICIIPFCFQLRLDKRHRFTQSYCTTKYHLSWHMWNDSNNWKKWCGVFHILRAKNIHCLKLLMFANSSGSFNLQMCRYGMVHIEQKNLWQQIDAIRNCYSKYVWTLCITTIMFVYSLSVVIIIHPCKDQNNEGQHMIRNIDSKVQKFNQDLRYHQVWNWSNLNITYTNNQSVSILSLLFLHLF